MLCYIDTKKEWRGEPIKGLRHPRNIEQLWTDAELQAVGLERYTPPAPEPAPAQPRRTGTFVEFMDMFTPEQQVAILAASKQSPALEILLMRATAQNQVDIDSPMLAAGLGPLMQAGILSADDVSAIQAEGFK